MSDDADKPQPDPRYVAAVKAQQEVTKQMTARKRPILRLVWNADEVVT